MVRVWSCALAAMLLSGVFSGWKPFCACASRAAVPIGFERLGRSAEALRHWSACGCVNAAVGVSGQCCETARREVAASKPAGPAKKARGWKSSRVRAAGGGVVAWADAVRPSRGAAGAAGLSNPALFDRVIAFQRFLL